MKRKRKKCDEHNSTPEGAVAPQKTRLWDLLRRDLGGGDSDVGPQSWKEQCVVKVNVLQMSGQPRNRMGRFLTL